MNQWPTVFQASPEPGSLISGFRIRWQLLTLSERLVCSWILLIPVWWLWGWSYLRVAIAIGIVIYTLRQERRLTLKRPSALVLLMVVYGLYGLISKYFYARYNTISLNPRELLGVLNTWFSPAFILWYIQSKDIRIRPLVVAWAFSVSVVSMLLFWCLIYFVFHQAEYIPPRSLFGLLTQKALVYVPGAGNSNYLLPYAPKDHSFAGFARYYSFFHGPESLSLIISFILLLALDLKNRGWSTLLFGGSFFLLLLSGTRSAALAMIAVLSLRWLLKTGKSWRFPFLCALLAIASFTILSVPPITKVIFDVSTSTVQATGNIRQDSTEVRGLIYEKTLDAISNSPNAVFLFGHVVEGPTVLRGYEPATIGSHSLYLGTLLYLRGIVGTGIFMSYWVALLTWLYQTRHGRPLSCLLMFIVFSITFCVMAFEPVVQYLILLCSMTRQSQLSPTHSSVAVL
ncbi:MAG: O-antigen ligase family protein [Leptolyngbyaceae cyanobacterium MAG.088]|nr:O-antigen ligase family protein [Leptolyngbyaceae cyanobacterium MAG.088]